jgi:hypothetical protein
MNPRPIVTGYGKCGGQSYRTIIRIVGTAAHFCRNLKWNLGLNPPSGPECQGSPPWALVTLLGQRCAVWRVLMTR